MQKHKTQQFSKFFLKDSKTKNPKYNNEKTNFDDMNMLPSS